MRFTEVQNAIADDPTLKAVVIVREEDHEPISILVSKAREDGEFFCDSDEAQIALADGHYLAGLDKTADRPDLRMLNRARKLLLQASIDESDVNIFRGNHNKIEAMVKRVIAAVAETAFGETEESWSWVKEVIPDVREGGIEPRIARTMLSRLREEVATLINSTKTASRRAYMRGNRVILTPKGQLRLFSRHDGKIPQGINFNSDVSLAPSQLPSPIISAESIADTRTNIVLGLSALKNDGVENPLTLVDPTDCVTNSLLFEMLRDQKFGNFMQKIGIDLSVDNWPKQKIAERIKQGGSFLVGGSHYDTYEGRGKVFKNEIGPLFLAALEDPDSSFCYVGVCWGYQQMSDLIGQKFCEGKVLTVPGPLEMGPTPIKKITNSVPLNHPLFNHLPARGTVQMTRSGHVVDLRGEALRASTQKYLRPIFTSELTQHPAGMIGMDGRFIGIQNHSEINSDDAVEKFLKQMEAHEDGLRTNFGIGLPDIEDNFNLMFGTVPKKQVSQDFSQALFLNSLNTSVQRCLELRGLR